MASNSFSVGAYFFSTGVKTRPPKRTGNNFYSLPVTIHSLLQNPRHRYVKRKVSKNLGDVARTVARFLWLGGSA